MFNYGYAILEAECLKAINSSGLDVHVGFLHEMNQSKNSLAYDFQEPFRFLIDLAIISAIENNIMEKSDFIRTENYNLRLRPSGAKKLLGEIDKQLTKKSLHNGQMWSWRYVITEKTIELSHFLQSKKDKLDFTTKYEIDRQDSEV
jgi:CRISPR-associated protein Cas1